MSSPDRSCLDLARWCAAIADVSGRGFDDIVASDVTLEGSVFFHPIGGIDSVWRTLTLVESLYEQTHFTREIHGKESAHFSWKGRAQGLTVKGETVLDLDHDGRVIRIVLHHRPFGAVLQIATTLADRIPPATNGNGRNNGPT